MNPSTALSRVLVDELARNGVRDVVLAPGSRSAPLAFALHAADAAGRLRLHVRIDERCAGFTAVGMAKSDGRPTAVVTTSGTAVANLHPSVLEPPLGNARGRAHGRPARRPARRRRQSDHGSGACLRRAVRLFHEIAAPDTRPGQVAYWRSTVSRACHRRAGATSTQTRARSTSMSASQSAGSRRRRSWVEPLGGREDGRAVDRGEPFAVSDRLGDGARRLVADGATVVVLGDAPSSAVRATWGVAAGRGWPVIAEPWARRITGVACGRLVVGSRNGCAGMLPTEYSWSAATDAVADQRGSSDHGAVAPVDVVTGPRWPTTAHAARVSRTGLWDATHVRGRLADRGVLALLSAWAARASERRDVSWMSSDRSAPLAPPSGTAAAREVLRGIRERRAVPGIVVGDPRRRPVGGASADRVLANRGVGGIDGTVSSAVGRHCAWPLRVRRPTRSWVT